MNEQSPILSHVVAVSEKGVIGFKNKLPWSMPSDLKMFKEITLNKPVVMGRKTFESIGHPLPDRDNIVVTHDEYFEHKDVVVVADLEEALECAEYCAARSGSDEICIIGGASLYDSTKDMVDRVHLTIIKDKGEIQGDLFYDWRDLESRFIEKERTEIEPASNELFARTYIKYERNH